MAKKRYVIEREIPNIGAASEQDLSQAAGTSNSALAKLAPRVQWEEVAEIKEATRGGFGATGN